MENKFRVVEFENGYAILTEKAQSCEIWYNCVLSLMAYGDNGLLIDEQEAGDYSFNNPDSDMYKDIFAIAGVDYQKFRMNCSFEVVNNEELAFCELLDEDEMTEEEARAIIGKVNELAANKSVETTGDIYTYFDGSNWRSIIIGTDSIGNEHDCKFADAETEADILEKYAEAKTKVWEEIYHGHSVDVDGYRFSTSMHEDEINHLGVWVEKI